MPVNVKEIIAAGFDYALVALLDGDGYPMGLAGSLSNGAGVGLQIMKGVQTANLNVPAAERITISGQNRPQGTFIFPPNEFPSFDIETSILNMDQAAAFEDQLVRDVGSMSIHPISGDTVYYRDALIWLLSQATSKEAGSDGLSCVYGLLGPRAKVAYLGPGSFQERTGRTFRMAVSLNPTSKYPWGEALTVEIDGANSAPLFETTTEYWPGLYVFQGDGVEDEITLDYVPDGDHTSEKIKVWTEGEILAATTDYTVTPATKLVALEAGALPAAAERSVVWFEHRRWA